MQPDSTVIGGDLVFAKLWLARHFVAPDARLACFDAARAWPLADASADLVFCHDAFYFLPEKAFVASEMLRVAGGGRVLVGHAHNAAVENLSHGAPLLPDAYASLFGPALLYDDRELTAALTASRPPRFVGAEDLLGAPAVALAAGAAAGDRPLAVSGGLAMPPDGRALQRNPLYVERFGGGTSLCFPSARYEAEYASLATYGASTDAPAHALAGDGRLAGAIRRRELLDLPVALVADNARLGWGIAGYGWVARDYAAPAIRASCNGTLLAVHDASEAALERARRDFGHVGCHAGLDAFLATKGLQAIYVATPNHAHRALVERAAAAGLAVLCEKPMATTLEDATGMVAACRAAGVRYATAFDQRFHPAHRHLARMVADGAIGKPVAIRVVYACWVDDGWAPDDLSTDNWRTDPARAGGGALFDLAPHGLDLAAMILGERIESVAALGQTRMHGYAVDDGALLMARSAGGVLVQMHVAYNCPETLPRRRLEVVGTSGQIVATDTMGQTAGGTLQLIDAVSGLVREVAVPDAGRAPFVGQMEAFAASVLDGSAFPFSPEHDLHTMALLEQAQSMIGKAGLRACR